MEFPDRLKALVSQLEAGTPVTNGDLDRTATLQALDIVRLGQEFVREAAARDAKLTDALTQAANQ